MHTLTHVTTWIHTITLAQMHTTIMNYIHTRIHMHTYIHAHTYIPVEVSLVTAFTAWPAADRTSVALAAALR